MRKMVLALSVIFLSLGPAQAAVVGKDGSTLADRVDIDTNQRSSVRADWEWSTAGTMDAVSINGGTSGGWGEHFIVQVTNDTGSDQLLVEFGFPCGGTIGSEWIVWLDPSMPAGFSGGDYSGAFTATDPDGQTVPPVNYTYIDVSADGVVIPDGQVFWFGYTNPGISGQIDFNGIDTYAWYGGLWDPDQNWNRTTVMQFKADNIPTQPTPTPPPGGDGGPPIPTLSTAGIFAMILLLIGIAFVVGIRRR